MTDSDRLIRLIKDKGMILKYIAKNLNITPYALTKKIKNINQFKSGEISAMCDLLGIYDLKVKEEIFFAPKVD